MRSREKKAFAILSSLPNSCQASSSSSTAGNCRIGTHGIPHQVCDRQSYHTLTLPSSVPEILSFSQNSPDDFPISPIASRSGILPPSSAIRSACDLWAGTKVNNLTKRLRRLAHLQTHVRVDPSRTTTSLISGRDAALNDQDVPVNQELRVL